MASSKTLKLNNWKEIPILGLGTWKSQPGEVAQAVKDAIDAGYRHIDGAHIYKNENEVGEGIRAKIDEGVIKREDIFVTSKLWNSFHRPDLVEKGARKTLEDLGLDYMDLYLIHFPMGYKEDRELIPHDENGKVLHSDADYVDTWKAMEKLLELGLVKSIGVSNFNSEQIERLLENTTVVPAINQIECHPYLNNKRLIKFCKSKGIAIVAYSPFGSPDRPWADPDEPKLLEDPKIVAIAEKYSKTTAQVILRWILQKEVIVIPKSITKERIIKNMDVFDFELSDDDIAVVDGMDRNWRAVLLSHDADHKYYPFNIEF